MLKTSKSIPSRFRPWHKQSTTTTLHVAWTLHWIQAIAALSGKPVEEVLAEQYHAMCDSIWGPRPVSAAMPSATPPAPKQRRDY